MEYEIVTLEEKIVEGIGTKTTNQNGQAQKDIGKLWQDIFQNNIYTSIEHPMNQKMIALYTEYEGDYTKPYTFLVGCQVKQASSSLDARMIKKIPAGKYAKFVIHGDIVKAVQEFWSNLWQMNLDRSYTCDFEEYQNNSLEQTEQEIHIYIALQ